ncbi:MAG: hypothetical protein ACPHE0_09725 [Pseudomonadales bacterium]
MNVSPEGVTRRLAAIRDEANLAGRPEATSMVQVRLGMERVNAESAAEYEAAGVTDLVMHVLSSDPHSQQTEIERFAAEMFH